MPSGLSYFNFLDKFISYIRCVWLFFNIVMFIEISNLNANSVDPNSIGSDDLGLHCLPMFLLWDARLKWVNNHFVNSTGLNKIFKPTKMLYLYADFLLHAGRSS